MKREKITISKSGIITLPDNPVETVWMRDFEIVELLGVVYGKHILPDYFGLDMITALAFRINSLKAKLFREYILGKLYAVNTQSAPNVIIQVNADKRFNKEKVIFN